MGAIKQKPWMCDMIREYHSRLTENQMVELTGMSKRWVRQFLQENNLVPKKGYRVPVKTIPPEISNKFQVYRSLPQPVAPKELVRPKAVYTNSPSPYGIADELHGIKTVLEP